MRRIRFDRLRAATRAEPDPREKQLVPPRLHEVAGGEPHDAAVSGAHVPGVGHLVCLPDADALGTGQSWARIA